MGLLGVEVRLHGLVRLGRGVGEHLHRQLLLSLQLFFSRLPLLVQLGTGGQLVLFALLLLHLALDGL